MGIMQYKVNSEEGKIEYRTPKGNATYPIMDEHQKNTFLSQLEAAGYQPA